MVLRKRFVDRRGRAPADAADARLKRELELYWDALAAEWIETLCRTVADRARAHARDARERVRVHRPRAPSPAGVAHAPGPA